MQSLVVIAIQKFGNLNLRSVQLPDLTGSISLPEQRRSPHRLCVERTSLLFGFIIRRQSFVLANSHGKEWLFSAWQQSATAAQPTAP